MNKNKNELRVYSIELKNFLGELDRCKNDLSPDELMRSGRFKHEQDRCSYVISHALLRRILAHHLDCSVSGIFFESNDKGKPFLPGHALHFNLSHSGGRTLIAVSFDEPVGVDIEQHREKKDLLQLALRYFTAHEHQYIANRIGQEQVIAFHRIWSAKEAYVKALGEGIAYGLDRFSVISPEGDFVTTIQELSLELLDINPHYSAAVAGCATHIAIYDDMP